MTPRIHVIDDDSLYHFLINEAFELDDFKVSAYLNKSEFFEINKNKSQDIEIMIVDHSLFDCAGVEIVEELRKENSTAKVCVVSVDGDCMSKEIKQALNITADLRKTDILGIKEWISKTHEEFLNYTQG